MPIRNLRVCLVVLATIAVCALLAGAQAQPPDAISLGDVPVGENTTATYTFQLRALGLRLSTDYSVRFQNGATTDPPFFLQAGGSTQRSEAAEREGAPLTSVFTELQGLFPEGSGLVVFLIHFRPVEAGTFSSRIIIRWTVLGAETSGLKAITVTGTGIPGEEGGETSGGVFGTLGETLGGLFDDMVDLAETMEEDEPDSTSSPTTGGTSEEPAESDGQSDTPGSASEGYIPIDPVFIGTIGDGCPEQCVLQSLFQLAAIYAVQDKLNQLLGLPTAPDAALLTLDMTQAGSMSLSGGPGAVEPGALVNVYYSIAAPPATLPAEWDGSFSYNHNPEEHVFLSIVDQATGDVGSGFDMAPSGAAPVLGTPPYQYVEVTQTIDGEESAPVVITRALQILKR